MKKFIALAIVAAMSAISMCACSINISTDSKSSNTSETSGTSTSSTSQASNLSSSSQNSEAETTSSVSSSESYRDELLSFTFKMDGAEYTIPCDFSEFAKLGYSFDKDDELNGNTYTIGVHAKNDDESLNVQMWNPTDSPKKYSECQVGSIEFALEDGHEIILPGDLKFDDTVTADVVKEKYGEPDDTTEGDGYVTLTYEKDIYEEVEFFLYTEEDMIKYNSVNFENFV